MWHVWGRRKIRAGFWWEKRRERGHLKNLSIDGKIILN
jgi:uncharacterized protein YjiS (DUF1127 family)